MLLGSDDELEILNRKEMEKKSAKLARMMIEEDMEEQKVAVDNENKSMKLID